MSIKTFRGLIANDTQVRIRLGTNQGLIGYKIKKFEFLAFFEIFDFFPIFGPKCPKNRKK